MIQYQIPDYITATVEKQTKTNKQKKTRIEQ